MTDPTTRFVRAGPLSGMPGLSPLVRDWLSIDTRLSGAAEAWRDCLASPSPDEPAPAWRSTVWRSAWWSEFSADLPDDASRDLAKHNVERLAAGAADVIVTGQQPGFLGGPLYTLFKTATCIAAAAERTAAGHPTVPLFWMGDDDDDLREAFAPSLYDPRRQTLLKPRTPEAAPSSTVGGLSARVAGTAARHWLEEQTGRSHMADRLAGLWKTAGVEDLNWGRLQRRALLALFGDRGLLVVSGDDSALHEAATPFYEVLNRDRDRLSALAAERGAALTKQGYHAQIGSESLSQPFSVAQDQRRLRLKAGEALPADVSRLRPGVLFRSPIQDWLFRPAGVVVGPGEFAYLTQLSTVYEALDLPRSPLLPRLFATLTPTREGADTSVIADETARSAILSRFETVVGQALDEALAEAFDPRTLAVSDRVDSFKSGLSDRSRSFFARLSSEASSSPDLPAWVSPGGKRQERTLAMYWALALWGDDLVAISLDASRKHLESGRTNEWQDWKLIVDGTRCEGTSP